MENRKGLTMLELIVVLFTLVFLIILIFPLFSTTISYDLPASRVVCGTNLKGLGTAMIVYANDYDDEFPKLGHGPWSKKLGYSYEDADFKPSDYEGPCTITSSLYLLVREADVAPKSFICPQQSNQIEFDGQNSKGLDIVELWDFGPDPYKHVSYAYQNPYGKCPPSGIHSAAFAVMADMSPWFMNGDIVNPNTNEKLPPQIVDITNTKTFKKSNSLNHTEYEENFLSFYKIKRRSNCGPGQNVLFGDGHTAFEKSPNVGVKHDNIYTFWSTRDNPTEQDIQGGTAPTSRSPENDAKSTNDSFLGI
ncbi:MAG: hypothetical protein ABFR90_07455 [Planctomycetota bacterium]